MEGVQVGYTNVSPGPSSNAQQHNPAPINSDRTGKYNANRSVISRRNKRDHLLEANFLLTSIEKNEVLLSANRFSRPLDSWKTALKNTALLIHLVKFFMSMDFIPSRIENIWHILLLMKYFAEGVLFCWIYFCICVCTSRDETKTSWLQSIGKTRLIIALSIVVVAVVLITLAIVLPIVLTRKLSFAGMKYSNLFHLNLFTLSWEKGVKCKRLILHFCT